MLDAFSKIIYRLIFTGGNMHKFWLFFILMLPLLRGHANEEIALSCKSYRNYNVQLSDSEEKDLHFILKTLALKSLIELAKYKSKLEKAGDRIDHVHPLNFLATVFSDEELKAYMHAIKKRGSFIWDKFINGLTDSLDEEYKSDNLKVEYLQDFSLRVGIDMGLIYPSVENRDWNDLVRQLIVHIPRNEDSQRYDM